MTEEELNKYLDNINKILTSFLGYIEMIALLNSNVEKQCGLTRIEIEYGTSRGIMYMSLEDEQAYAGMSI